MRAIILCLLCTYSITINAQTTKDTTKPKKQSYYGFAYLSYSTGTLTQTYEPSIGSLATSPAPIHLEGINSVNDYKFNSIIAAGANIGMMRYSTGYEDYYLVPIMADVRVFIPIAKLKFFASADGGYIASLSTIQQGRTIVSPSIGIAIPLNNKVGIAVTIAYEMQHYNSTYSFQELTFQSNTSGQGFDNTGNGYTTISGTVAETLNLFKFGVGITF